MHSAFEHDLVKSGLAKTAEDSEPCEVVPHHCLIHMVNNLWNLLLEPLIRTALTRSNSAQTDEKHQYVRYEFSTIVKLASHRRQPPIPNRN